VFCVHLPAWWTRYLDSVLAAGLVQLPFSLLFLELISYYVTLFSYMSTPQTSWSGAAYTGRAPDNRLLGDSVVGELVAATRTEW
jgi:hypothetical protein